jgi:hypothetical protein
MNSKADSTGEWVLLSYRLPREPSTPRSAVWRKLRRLGVAQIGDGLVALPATARTREQLEWIAEEVTDAAGTATMWLARPATRAQEQQLVEGMKGARAVEYQALITTISAASTPATRQVVRRLRNELRAIQRRDYFPPPEGEQAQAAVRDLTPSPAGSPIPAGGLMEQVR